jgi:hypothetical protein
MLFGFSENFVVFIELIANQSLLRAALPCTVSNSKLASTFLHLLVT